MTATTLTVADSMPFALDFSVMYGITGFGFTGSAPYVHVTPAVVEKLASKEYNEYRVGIASIRQNLNRSRDAWQTYFEMLCAFPVPNLRAGFAAVLAFSDEYIRLLGLPELLGNPTDAGRLALLVALRGLMSYESMLTEKELSELSVFRYNLSTPYHPRVIAVVDYELFHPEVRKIGKAA